MRECDSSLPSEGPRPAGTQRHLPTRQQCFELMQELHVPLHIKKHSIAVTKFGVFLASKLEEKGVLVDVDLVDRACLLHDILRICDLRESDYRKLAEAATEQDRAQWQSLRTEYKAVRHEEAAYEFLKQEYPELALTIKKHRYMALLDEKEGPATWEEKLVYYADKRVMADRIVPLQTRLAEAHKRNIYLHGSKTQSRINTAKVDPLIFELEKEIFDRIGLDPIEVADEFVNSHLNKMLKED
jgi:uncharacterized protein